MIPTDAQMISLMSAAIDYCAQTPPRTKCTVEPSIAKNIAERVRGLSDEWLFVIFASETRKQFDRAVEILNDART